MKERKYLDAEQECIACGHKFIVRYWEDEDLDYVTEPCDCSAEYQPVEGNPSFSQWLKSIKLRCSQ